jgi:starch phosphorylase
MPKNHHHHYTKTALKEAIAGKLQRHFGREVADASKEQVYEACALVVRDELTDHMIETQNEVEKNGERQVHYLCMEFLVGRSLRNNAYNLGMLEPLTAALKDMGYEMADIFEQEDDPGLGNGGLGRLAACYMDGMATTGIRGTGYSIRYEHGIFKQKIENGAQVELPDSWLASGDVWHIPAEDDVREVKIGGHLNSYFDDNGKFQVEYLDYTPVLAVPYDMPISGYGTDNICCLRLWQAKSPIALDYKLFSSGEYLKAMEKHTMAATISMILYPEDNHREGQSLRLRQQYFLVSATLQDICAKHKAQYGTLDNFAHKHVLHINDTHPTLVIPELMRILMDENDMSWENAWNIVTQSVAYTNHTVMPEALECWPVDLVQELMPRIMQIIYEINERFCRELNSYFPNDSGKISRLAIVANNTVRMAHLAIAGSFSINGVSALHSNILKERVFNEFYSIYSSKFCNVTNGIAHRRWLCEANPLLADLIEKRIGTGYRTHPSELQVLAGMGEDKELLAQLGDIKRQNKQRLAEYIKEHNGIEVNMNSIFDVQVKRLHEYKRQMLNILHIVSLYHKLKDNPHLDFVPRTFIFGSKAAPGYAVAKKTICLINSIANMINNDPAIGDKLKVVFIEDYKVSLAEMIMPAAELSEQISIAGKEASGTGNMKFMMNGALTIGTMDGANVEICEAVGKENIFIFGMETPEAEALSASGTYDPMRIYSSNPVLRRVIDNMISGFGDGVDYKDLANLLLHGGNGGPADRYMIFKDFDSYAAAQERVSDMYRRPENWNYMSLMNIANSGRFASDRSVAEYAQNIWKVKTNFAF